MRAKSDRSEQFFANNTARLGLNAIAAAAPHGSKIALAQSLTRGRTGDPSEMLEHSRDSLAADQIRQLQRSPVSALGDSKAKEASPRLSSGMNLKSLLNADESRSTSFQPEHDWFNGNADPSGVGSAWAAGLSLHV